MWYIKIANTRKWTMISCLVLCLTWLVSCNSTDKDLSDTSSSAYPEEVTTSPNALETHTDTEIDMPDTSGTPETVDTHGMLITSEVTQPPMEPMTTAFAEANTREATTSTVVSETQASLPAVISPSQGIILPEASDVFSKTLASQLLALCSQSDAGATAKLLRTSGFEVLLQAHYDKASDDVSHTCAYTIGKGKVHFKGEERVAILISIRGTVSGEWFSNFDFSPSRDNDSAYAENFMLAAQDVYTGIADILAKEEQPLLLVCGHSRGAACANLLGLLLNAEHPRENTFVYTFATPTTIRVTPEVVCTNVFNLIHPGDLVTSVPLAAWGFHRVGQDILLDSDATSATRVQEIITILQKMAPTVSSYYKDRHSLTGAGLSSQGRTAFEMMQSLCRMLMAFSTGEQLTIDWELLMMSPQSDLHPLMDIMINMLTEMGQGGISIAANHMPSTYQHLILSLPDER